jgi:hypothetical protein
MADPVAWTMVKPGSRVRSRSGEDLGRVREAMGEAEADIFNGLLVENGLLRGSEYVPSEQVGEIREGEVTLAR